MGLRPLGLPWQYVKPEPPGAEAVYWSQPGRRGMGWILSMCELSIGEPVLIEGKGQETAGSVGEQRGPR